MTNEQIVEKVRLMLEGRAETSGSFNKIKVAGHKGSTHISLERSYEAVISFAVLDVLVPDPEGGEDIECVILVMPKADFEKRFK